jgi:hypothetical protein
LTHPASFPGETLTIHPFETKNVFVMDVRDKRSPNESGFVQVGIRERLCVPANLADRIGNDLALRDWNIAQ